MKILFVYNLVTLFMLLSFYGTSQVLIYDVYKGDNPIGVLKAHLIQKDTSTKQYLIETEVKFRVFKEFVVNSTFESVFNGDQLTYAKTLNLLNGKKREASKVVWDGKQYICEREGEQTFLRKPINHSVAKLYFEEPKIQKHTFSERFIENCSISKGEKPASYFLHLPDGKQNEYTYENGICKEVKVELFLATIYFKLREETLPRQALNQKH